MAIDTAQKRASATGVGVPFVVNLIPDGSLDQGDRQTISMSYRGILAITAITQIIGTITVQYAASLINTNYAKDVILSSYKQRTISAKYKA